MMDDDLLWSYIIISLYILRRKQQATTTKEVTNHQYYHNELESFYERPADRIRGRRRYRARHAGRAGSGKTQSGICLCQPDRRCRMDWPTK